MRHESLGGVGRAGQEQRAIGKRLFATQYMDSSGRCIMALHTVDVAFDLGQSIMYFSTWPEPFMNEECLTQLCVEQFVNVNSRIT